MYYAGETGKRLPVPIFQAIECTVVYLIALQVERFVTSRQLPPGIVTATGPASYHVAVCQEKLGDKTEARKYYEQYLKILPEGPLAKDAHTSLARLEKAH